MRAGVSRFFSMLAIIQSRVEPADEAVAVMPADPEAHYTRGLSLVNAERLDEALGELREATRLRPHHYYQWLDLGVTLDRFGDRAGAEAAFRKSISLAPLFAQPHWQLGNMLYRAERYPEAFEELRRGTRSNRNLTDGLLRLAWAQANGDVAAVLQMVQPVSRRNHIDLARFLAGQGKGSDSAAQVREAGDAGSDEERNLLRETVVQLLAARDFSNALEIWRLTHASSVRNDASAQIVNGDFLDSILRGDPGFGWQLPEVANASVAIDTASPGLGSRSLRIEFSGDNAPLTPLVNQLVLLEPGKRYSLSFIAKTENLVSGGPPVIAALAMTGDPPKIIGQSALLSVGTTAWTPYHFEFWTDDATRAVVFSLQRQPCNQLPCPIFGKLWLSKFSLAKTK